MTQPVLIFKRDPAVILALVAATIQAVSAFFFHLTVNQQSGLNAAAAGILGLVVAFIVHDGIVAAVTALFQALIAASVGFGANLTPDQQTIIMVLVAAAAAAFVRTQVTAPVSLEQYRAAKASRASLRTAA